MGINSDIYIIGIAVLVFLVIVFLFIKKASNESKLKLKIENTKEFSHSNDQDEILKNQQSFNFQNNESIEKELVIFNLISMDRSMFDIEQLFGFLLNYGAKYTNNIFSLYQDNDVENFRIINALKPGTFGEGTKTFAVAIVSDLNMVDDPLKTVKQMIEFSIGFADKFYATLCDQDRTPITKQMISHIETRAQDIARIKQLNNISNEVR